MTAFSFPYLDGHVHIFPQAWQRRIYSWFARDGWQVLYDNRFEEDIWTMLEGLGAGGASILVYAHKPGLARQLNRWLFQWAQGRPRLRLYGTVHPDDEDFAGIVREALDEFHFAGFKIHANVQEVRVDDCRLWPLYEMILERGRSLVIHAGREPHRKDTVGVSFFVALMSRFPGLRVQVAHLGYDEVDQFVKLMEEFPGIYLDTAAIPGTRLPLSSRKLREIMDRFPRRIIYGSDAPILEEAIEVHRQRIWEAAGSDIKRRQIFRENLLDFWGPPFNSLE